MANIGLSRSGDLFADPITVLREAKFLFEKSLSLDNSYIPSKQNLVILNFLNSYINNTIKDFFNTSEFSSLDEKSQGDLKVISMILDGKKIKKIEQLLDDRSEISLYNLYESNKAEVSNTNVLSKFNIDESVKIFGIQRPYEYLNTQYGKLNFKFKIENNFVIYELDDHYVIKSSLNSFEKDKGIIYNDKAYFLID